MRSQGAVSSAKISWQLSGEGSEETLWTNLYLMPVQLQYTLKWSFMNIEFETSIRRLSFFLFFFLPSTGYQNCSDESLKVQLKLNYVMIRWEQYLINIFHKLWWYCNRQLWSSQAYTSELIQCCDCRFLTAQFSLLKKKWKNWVHPRKLAHAKFFEKKNGIISHR